MATFGTKEQVKTHEFVSVICHPGYLKEMLSNNFICVLEFWQKACEIIS